MFGGVGMSRTVVHRIVPLGDSLDSRSAITVHSLLPSRNLASCALEIVKALEILFGGPGEYCRKTPLCMWGLLASSAVATGHASASAAQSSIRLGRMMVVGRWLINHRR